MTQYGNALVRRVPALGVGRLRRRVRQPPRLDRIDRGRGCRSIRSPIAEEAPGTGWGGIDYEDLMAVVDAALERVPVHRPRPARRARRLLRRLHGELDGRPHRPLRRRLLGAGGATTCTPSRPAPTPPASSASRSASATSTRPRSTCVSRRSPTCGTSHTPVLILHSEQDLRCPIEQADQLFVALRMLGREVEYHRFPGESHELSRSGSPKHRVQRAEIILDFFDRHLQAAAGERRAPSARLRRRCRFPQRRLRRLRRTPCAAPPGGRDDRAGRRPDRAAVRARGDHEPQPIASLPSRTSPAERGPAGAPLWALDSF